MEATLPQLPVSRPPSRSSAVSKRSRLSTGSSNRKQVENAQLLESQAQADIVRPVTAPSRISGGFSASRASYTRDWKTCSVFDPVIKEARKQAVCL